MMIIETAAEVVEKFSELSELWGGGGKDWIMQMRQLVELRVISVAGCWQTS